MDQTGFVQEEARQKIDQDISERIQVHKANIARLAAAQQSAHTLGAAVQNRPLVMLAQGDSWFDYPLSGNGLPLVDTDVIAQLRRTNVYLLENVSSDVSATDIRRRAHKGQAIHGLVSARVEEYIHKQGLYS